ncbi:MAG: 2-oxo acid dehydrogenase subunit E2 [Paludibacter sp.]|nr:2-oxo acid dehydrogenase subunit E2 [Paludibacter sp.]
MDKLNKLKYYRWSLGDRYDGWRVRKVDPLFSVVPFILPKRVDSEVFFEVKIPIDTVEDFIRKHKEDIPNLSLMHVVMASLVRLISQRPYINRFIVWNKIFARNHVSFSIAIKRSMTDEGEETVVKPYFLPTDTLQDIVRKTKLELENNQQVGQENSSDSISKIMGYLPDILLRSVIFFIKLLDKIGIMPKLFFEASPFHTSLFLTNLGSIGIESIYHHLYEFGTCSMFASMGKKTKKNVVNNDGTIKSVRTITLKFVLDERICDGFYYASTMRMLEKILNNPSVLLLPPEQVIVDDGVGKKRIDI